MERRQCPECGRSLHSDKSFRLYCSCGWKDGRGRTVMDPTKDIRLSEPLDLVDWRG